jgi:hypothetical protein
MDGIRVLATDGAWSTPLSAKYPDRELIIRGVCGKLTNLEEHTEITNEETS